MAGEALGGAGQGAAQGASYGGVWGAIIGGALGAYGGYQQAQMSKRFRRRQRAAIEQARKFADETVAKVTSSELFTSAKNFLQNTFSNAADSPLAIDFAKRIRAQQSVRGTFTGNISAAQEAVGTSGFAQQLRTNLLPSALQYAEAPERLRQSVLASDAPLRVAAATGAPLVGLPSGFQSDLGGALAGGISGASGGFQIGTQFDQQRRFDLQLEEIRKARADRSGAPSTEGQTAANDVEQLIAALGGYA